jgi:hypothetical protein
MAKWVINMKYLHVLYKVINGQYVILGFRFQSVAAGHLVGAHHQCKAEEQQQECTEVERKHHMAINGRRLRWNKIGSTRTNGSTIFCRI